MECLCDYEYEMINTLWNFSSVHFHTAYFMGIQIENGYRYPSHIMGNIGPWNQVTRNKMWKNLCAIFTKYVWWGISLMCMQDTEMLKTQRNTMSCAVHTNAPISSFDQWVKIDILTGLTAVNSICPFIKPCCSNYRKRLHFSGKHFVTHTDWMNERE